MSTRSSTMRAPSRWFWPALLPIAAGIFWLAVGWRAGLVAGLFASLPGALMLAPGLALLLWPGDRHMIHYLALSGLASTLLALPMAFLAGPLFAIVLAALGVAGFLIAGYAALFQARIPRSIPLAKLTLRMARKAGFDEALLAYFVLSARVPTGQDVLDDARELTAARDLIQTNGWHEHPERLHQPPPPPGDAVLRATREGGESFLHLGFTSGFEPHPELPGGERWQRFAANRGMHARVFLHADGPRPWLLGVHGYRMGRARMDFSLFGAAWLHRTLGFNVVLPILPLHGPRRAYWRSGSGYLDGNLIAVMHAQTQAAWDLRRTLAWIRQQDPQARIGVLGFSLGAYSAALLATLDRDLAGICVAIPAADIPELIWPHMPQLHRQYLQSCGVTQALARAVLAPVSPLSAAPLVAREHRYIAAAVGDQLVPPAHALRLAKHWQDPETLWYQGSHLSVRREPSVNRFIGKALAQMGLVDAAAGGLRLAAAPRD